MEKTLHEIIEATRNGEKLSADELRYALCAMDALATFDRIALMRLSEAEEKGKSPFMTTSARWQWNEHFNRRKRAGNTPPKQFVGWNNDPDNPEFLARRGYSIKLMEAVARKTDA